VVTDLLLAVVPSLCLPYKKWFERKWPSRVQRKAVQGNEAEMGGAYRQTDCDGSSACTSQARLSELSTIKQCPGYR
jgi:hypothetical protein